VLVQVLVRQGLAWRGNSSSKGVGDWGKGTKGGATCTLETDERQADIVEVRDQAFEDVGEDA
jgi:hypothetical protein